MAGNSNTLTSETEFDVGDAKVQMSGMLMKRPFGSKKSGKWQRRWEHLYELYTLLLKVSIFLSHTHDRYPRIILDCVLKVLYSEGRIHAVLQ